VTLSPAQPTGDHSFDPSARWFQHAVFYEVFIRGFYDRNDDGVGDLQGLREKLDYLEWLGVDCLWLLPFYPSPMRDGGYDIADFFNVHPDYGTLGELIGLLEDAHRRGIRVIADLIMNHTSDQHPWFVESRSSRTNPRADWYVWNDDDQRWPEARVVFTDVERSNWTWDDGRQQYYWHRFYSHQPDLNYDNPEVADTMIDLVRFWLDLGFDGFRLDAVPYLFQRDGTAGEHLPETHLYIRRIRKQLEADYPGRILLAEANGWPADVADYFGEGDECHLCFHFPLMPRLFMAVRREQRYPITEILSQTPTLPAGCQWAIFLRNHDELTLEQVSDEERDYLFAEYAKDPRMKRHMGIGRRLAPLLDGDRRLAELLYSMLLSLPGSPVIYYGDELLMGDNIYLGDRDSVRTPMQWSPDRNGGFSKADFAQLYLPPSMDPVYGFGAVNAEAQLRNPGSFLHWLRGMLVERRGLPVLGAGEMELISCPNPSVLAYVRSGEVADVLDPGPGGAPAGPSSGPTGAATYPVPIDGIGVPDDLRPPGTAGWQHWDEQPSGVRTLPAGNEGPGVASVHRSQAVLCVHNLSRFAQPAELVLGRWAGYTPIEVLGRVPFSVIGDEPYHVTLGPYGYLWFDLVESPPVPEDLLP
jgi:maltose alpha-D-glucosyltransferase/alpha-amylase